MELWALPRLARPCHPQPETERTFAGHTYPLKTTARKSQHAPYAHYWGPKVCQALGESGGATPHTGWSWPTSWPNWWGPAVEKDGQRPCFSQRSIQPLPDGALDDLCLWVIAGIGIARRWEKSLLGHQCLAAMLAAFLTLRLTSLRSDPFCLPRRWQPKANAIGNRLQIRIPLISHRGSIFPSPKRSWYTLSAAPVDPARPFSCSCETRLEHLGSRSPGWWSCVAWRAVFSHRNWNFSTTNSEIPAQGLTLISFSLQRTWACLRAPSFTPWCWTAPVDERGPPSPAPMICAVKGRTKTRTTTNMQNHLCAWVTPLTWSLKNLLDFLTGCRGDEQGCKQSGAFLFASTCQVMEGDAVTVEMSPFDLTKGRIVFRLLESMQSSSLSCFCRKQQRSRRTSENSCECARVASANGCKGHKPLQLTDA